MSQTLAGNSIRSRATTAKVVNIILWVLQIGAAAMFLMAGFAKLSGDQMMVKVFDAIGAGQWFRYLTGALEVSGALALLTPWLSGPGALLLVCVMLGAVATHIFIIGGSPAMAVLLLIVTATIAWGRRDRTRRLLGR
jgi:putative oxidoreductase